MALITYPAEVDIKEVSRRIQQWFHHKNFETRALKVDDSYIIKARKKSAFRAIVAADRALEVAARNFNGEAQVDVKQGSWKTNAISNAVWFVATGGMMLLVSGWSIVAQKELESRIRAILEDVAGAQEVDLFSK
jgi:hypothetical protein